MWDQGESLQNCQFLNELLPASPSGCNIVCAFQPLLIVSSHKVPFKKRLPPTNKRLSINVLPYETPSKIIEGKIIHDSEGRALNTVNIWGKFCVFISGRFSTRGRNPKKHQLNHLKQG